MHTPPFPPILYTTPHNLSPASLPSPYSPAQGRLPPPLVPALSPPYHPLSLHQVDQTCSMDIFYGGDEDSNRTEAPFYFD